jgi:hypothetical protein
MPYGRGYDVPFLSHTKKQKCWTKAGKDVIIVTV